MTTQEETKEEVTIKLKKSLLATDLYLTKEEEEKYNLFRIPFTVYFLWKDIRYNKYRLVVKELLDCESVYNSEGVCMYKYKII